MLEIAVVGQSVGLVDGHVRVGIVMMLMNRTNLQLDRVSMLVEGYTILGSVDSIVGHDGSLKVRVSK